MKTKPILIVSASIILLVSLFLFSGCKNSEKPEKSEITQFLNGFNNRIVGGNADSLLSYFEADKKIKILRGLVNILAGKTGLNGKGKPIANVALDIDGSDIKFEDDLVTANIPITFTHNKLETRHSILTLRIHRIAPHRYKIIQADARLFLTDYLAYENFVRSNTIDEKDLFSPITLASFKTSEELKTRYDSVIWFAHMDNKTFYYVAKGKWNTDNDRSRYNDTMTGLHKMGLVNPELKEIIPVEYDLIYNISGTFPGLVEVEKGEKRGFYDMSGKIVVPVNYEQIFPLEEDANLAVLRTGKDYFYLKNDMSISEKVDLKIGDFFSKIKNLKNAYALNPGATGIITEYNSREANGAVYIAPSYLADLNMAEKVMDFINPLRKEGNEEGTKKYEVKLSGRSKKTDNWLEATFYSIRDYFLGGRTEFYDKKNMVIIDKKKDRILTHDIIIDYSGEEDGGGLIEDVCDLNSVKAINDSLFEVKTGASLSIQLYDSTKNIVSGTYYHYLSIVDNKLMEQPQTRNFEFTKYIKMNDSYLNGCYTLFVGLGDNDKRQKKTINLITPEMLSYMKNEIYADYAYQFKDKRWASIFENMPSYSVHLNQNKPNNVNVDEYLTEIDKYNINWINQKLKAQTHKAITLAAK